MQNKQEQEEVYDLLGEKESQATMIAGQVNIEGEQPQFHK